MARTYRSKFLTKVVNAAVRRSVERGRGDPRRHLLTTIGRKSGLERIVPLTIVEVNGHRWLVSPYGWVSWALNLRTAGGGVLSRGGLSQPFKADQVDSDEAAPVLRHYLETVPIVRPYFDVTRKSSLDDIAAEAPRHPVFRIGPES
jgi:deazaflavin-dependent oxidoreductase (nitroreductase family)